MIPLVYPIAILAMLALNIIPKPMDTRMYGPMSMPWREAVNYVIGGPIDYLRDVVLMIAVPLLIIRGRAGLFIFFYLCAVWLLCLNPLLAPWWMKNILAYCYFRLVYLLQLPLLCTLVAAAGPLLARPGILLRERLTTALAVLSRGCELRLQLSWTCNPPERSKARHRLEIGDGVPTAPGKHCFCQSCRPIHCTCQAACTKLDCEL